MPWTILWRVSTNGIFSEAASERTSLCFMMEHSCEMARWLPWQLMQRGIILLSTVRAGFVCFSAAEDATQLSSARFVNMSHSVTWKANLNFRYVGKNLVLNSAEKNIFWQNLASELQTYCAGGVFSLTVNSDTSIEVSNLDHFAWHASKNSNKLNSSICCEISLTIPILRVRYAGMNALRPSWASLALFVRLLAAFAEFMSTRTLPRPTFLISLMFT